jgi:hypothetical protein
MFKIQAIILFCCLVLLSIECSCQIYLEKDQKALYFVGRSTSFKAGIIAKEFNSIDTTLTHIGIGMFINDTLKIYNVSDSEQDRFGSNLLCQSIKEFSNITDIINIKIFKLKVSKKIRRNILSAISKYQSRKITFDYDFKFENGDSLYCSEFVFQLLKEVGLNDINKTYFQKKVLSPFLSYALKRETLFYIPVDFFLSLKDVKHIFEQNFPNKL